MRIPESIKDAKKFVQLASSEDLLVAYRYYKRLINGCRSTTAMVRLCRISDKLYVELCRRKIQPPQEV